MGIRIRIRHQLGRNVSVSSGVLGPAVLILLALGGVVALGAVVVIALAGGGWVTAVTFPIGLVALGLFLRWGVRRENRRDAERAERARLANRR